MGYEEEFVEFEPGADQYAYMKNAGEYGPGLANEAECEIVEYEMPATTCPAYDKNGEPKGYAFIRIRIRSEEFGIHAGLDLLSGNVRQMNPGSNGRFKVPHIGWNSLDSFDGSAPLGAAWNGTLLGSVSEGSFMYFVHSYVVEPADPAVRIATTSYGDDSYCSVFKKDNISGVQFHPELSGEDGLNIYRSFVHENDGL